ncbi:hypothetical protein AXG93_4295s1040 [Marchantia polymorpha subsp. ruderalis]|nr:hypothetical protein AXG93_4295s1040 [Marchantia polymorpha subsp. ruderalis]
MMIFYALILLLWSVPLHAAGGFTKHDKDLVAFALNLEYLEAEFFLHGALGYGLDKKAPYLAAGGPPPLGAEKAKLDPLVYDLVGQMGLQEVGHIRAIKESIGHVAFPRPRLDISKKTWAKTMDHAFNKTLSPPFDAYANSINYMLASYAIPYVGLTGYTGAAPLLIGSGAKSLVARLLGVESGQDAIIRTWLYERKSEKVKPYDFTVAEATVEISKLRNHLDHHGLMVVKGKKLPFEVDDEGLVVPKELGAEKETSGNVLSADKNSISYQRTPEQILSVVYSSGNPKVSGGFYPDGARGEIAERYHKYRAKH